MRCRPRDRSVNRSGILDSRSKVSRMEVETLVNSMSVVELVASTRSEAVRQLVDAVDWEKHSLSPDVVVNAIEEREATAQTIIAGDLAMPHAMIDWAGDFCVVFGRSRNGVSYGASGDKIHLIVLVVVGQGNPQRHLEVLAVVAELLNNEEFRRSLIAAKTVKGIRRLLVERCRYRCPKQIPPAESPQMSIAIVQHAVGLAESISAQALLLALDHYHSVPWIPLAAWDGPLLIITSKSSDDVVVDRDNTHLFDSPHNSLSRMDRANLGLLLAAANGVLNHESDVVCITGPRGMTLDSITVIRPAIHFSAVFSMRERRTAPKVPPTVILRVLSLAIELASEGREAHPIGAMFVIGDARQVLRHTQQLVLNPFHGFARRLRNILDPSLAETVKEFAMLDGAFVIQADGTIWSAGTYLIPKSRTIDLPGGLGARHQAAAAITTETKAIAVTVSQSTGTVTLFQDGKIVLTLERATLTRW